MSEVVSLQRTASDPRGGTIVVTVDGNGLLVTVQFPVVPGDRVADSLLAQLDGDGIFTFSYRVRLYPHVRLSNELAKAIEHLYTAFGGMFQHKNPSFGAVEATDAERLREGVRPLVVLGKDLYTRLFHLTTNHHVLIDVDPKYIPPYRHLLQRWLSDTPEIQIVAPRHLIPWTIICTPNSDLDAPMVVNSAWGLCKSVQVLDSSLAQGLRLAGPWSLIAAIEQDDPSILVGSEVHHANEHPFAQVQDFVARPRDPKRMFQLLADADVLYHFGHASSSAHGHEFGRIKLGKEDVSALTLSSWYELNELDRPGRPPILVFLNACSTAVEAGDDESIPSILVKYGHRIFYFVTTLGSVPAWPAAMFAEAFFRAFLPRDPSVPSVSLGESILQARRALLTTYGNPIGLLYAAYGRLATTIDPTKDTNQ